MSAIRPAFGRARRACGLVLGGFLAFLMRPALEGGAPEGVSPAGAAVWLLIFSFAATAVFAMAAAPFLLWSGAAPGENLTSVFQGPTVSVVLAVVVLGPLVEEVMFRGWLKGTRGALAGSALFVAIWFGGVAWLKAQGPDAAGPLVLAGLAALALAAYAVAARTGPGAPLSWFRAIFPFAFWIQGLLFGALHFANTESPSIALSVLITAPYVICGWLWGYARVKLGLGTAWALHMTYNAPAVAALMAMMAFQRT